MNKAIVTLILFAVSITDVYAQKKDSLEKVPLLRLTEVHVGVGVQKFLHLGLRQRITGPFFFEADLGLFPFIEDGYYAQSCGLGFAPDNTQSEAGLYYTLIYSQSATDPSIFSHEDLYYRILTANVGWLSQHVDHISFLGRLGVGVAQVNTPTYISIDNVSWDREYQLWGNIEISVGYAF